MTDDLLTLMAQVGGQLSGMMVKTGFQTMGSMMGLMGSIANPLLFLPGTALAAVGPIVAAAILMGILK